MVAAARFDSHAYGLDARVIVRALLAVLNEMLVVAGAELLRKTMPAIQNAHMRERTIAGLSIAAAMMFGCLSGDLPAGQSSPDSVAAAQTYLIGLTVPDAMDTEVPANIQSGIVRLKKAVALETDSVVSRLPANATTFAWQHELSAAMPQSVGEISDQRWISLGNDDSKQPVAGLYGGALTVQVTRPSPAWTLVQETFNAGCGGDTMLLVYRKTGAAWKRALLWQSGAYDQISGAFGDTYKTLLLRARHDGHPLLLVLHGTPWCSSTMSLFRMDILELGGAVSEKTFWSGVHNYRRDDLDPPLTLRPTAGGFEVQTSVSTEGDNVARKGILRYSVSQDGVHRLEPLALNGWESVEEWLALPSDEARDFADETRDSLTWKMFKDFSYVGRTDIEISYPEFGAVRGCTDSPAHFQVEVTGRIIDPALVGSRPGVAYFVQLREVRNGYRIHIVTSVADRSCRGPDLMARN